MGHRRALAIALGAETVGSEKAAALGMVNGVFADKESGMPAIETVFRACHLSEAH